MSRSTVVHVEFDTKTTVRTVVDLATLAEVFCYLTDDEMARFFVEVAKRAAAWEGEGSADSHWYATGRHLAKCECSTDEARQMIKEIYDAMTMEDRIRARAAQNAMGMLS